MHGERVFAPIYEVSSKCTIVGRRPIKVVLHEVFQQTLNTRKTESHGKKSMSKPICTLSQECQSLWNF